MKERCPGCGDILCECGPRHRVGQAPIPVNPPASPVSVQSAVEGVKEKEDPLIKEIQRRFQEFLAKETRPSVTDKVTKMFHAALEEWVRTQPKWSDLYDVRVVDEGDNKITVTLFDKLGRQLSFEDGNPIKEKDND